MKYHNSIRYVVILISVIIFSYQISNAWKQLISKPILDKTEYFPITDLDNPPIITFCPKQPIMNKSKELLKKWGYDKPKSPSLDFHIFDIHVKVLLRLDKMELLYFMKGNVIFKLKSNDRGL